MKITRKTRQKNINLHDTLRKLLKAKAAINYVHKIRIMKIEDNTNSFQQRDTCTSGLSHDTVRSNSVSCTKLFLKILLKLCTGYTAQ